MTGEDEKALAARDAVTQVILGGFFVVISLPVLAGYFFETRAVDRIILIISGLTILLIGVAFIERGRRIHRRSHTHWLD